MSTSKYESEDGDYHLVVSDTAAEGCATGATMVVEAPDPNCARGSPLVGQVSRARAAAAAMLGVPGPRLRPVSPPKRARLVGVPFWDKRHGQSGMAPNGIELHPLLSVEGL